MKTGLLALAAAAVRNGRRGRDSPRRRKYAGRGRNRNDLREGCAQSSERGQLQLGGLRRHRDWLDREHRQHLDRLQERDRHLEAARRDLLGERDPYSLGDLGGPRRLQHNVDRARADRHRSRLRRKRQAELLRLVEIVPDQSITIRNLKIVPGDLITASVVVNGTEVLMQVKNRTRKTVFTKRETFANPDLSSAEWIAEAPSACTSNGFCRQVPLANFGSVTFTKVAALATIAGLGNQGGTISSPCGRRRQSNSSLRHSASSAISSSGRTRHRSAGATPYGLTGDGSSFSVNWVPNATSSG